MSIPNPIPHKTLYINDYICSCYAFVFIFEFSEYISKHILQFHASRLNRNLPRDWEEHGGLTVCISCGIRLLCPTIS